MRTRLQVAVVVCTLAAVDLTAQEVPADSRPEREGIALVGIWEPSPVRIGILVPLSDRWALRPEIGGDAYKIEGQAENTTLMTAVSLLRRSAPSEAGFVYGVARVARYVDAYGNGPRLTGYQAGVGAGGHAHVNTILAIFAEGGIVAVYAEENDASTTIDRSIRVFTRFGFAVRRPRSRD
jgi:hypothetical protein